MTRFLQLTKSCLKVSGLSLPLLFLPWKKKFSSSQAANKLYGTLMKACFIIHLSMRNGDFSIAYTMVTDVHCRKLWLLLKSGQFYLPSPVAF